MLPKNVQYLILAAGVLILAVILAVNFWPEGAPDPPDVLQQRIVSGETVKEQSQAAQDMIYHGESARGYAGPALERYHGKEPEVVVPLIQATQKARDWRSLPELFKLMEHPDPRIRGKAGAAAQEIMGADYFFRANDPPEKRAEKLAMMKESYRNLVPDLERCYPYKK